MTEQGFETGLVKATNVYLPMISNTLENNQIEMTDYQRQCVMSAITEISEVLEAKGKGFADVDNRTLTKALLATATLELNPSATPREIYFIIRNKKVNNNWVPHIEHGIEGDGNDALLARFGRDVQTVHKFWEVREGDSFEYPSYTGLSVSPPKWGPTGKGKVVRIVYPITKTTGEVEFLIAERDDVDRNLKAHIRNNLMNETFGIAENRYKANASQLKEIEIKKKEITELIEGKSLEEILKDPALQPYMSPAWREEQSSEAMIIRKMRNNIVKKYPKDFNNALLRQVYTDTTDETIKSMRRDVTENANTELLDFSPTEKEEMNERVIDAETGEIIYESEPIEQPSQKKQTVENVEDIPLFNSGVKSTLDDGAPF